MTNSYNNADISNYPLDFYDEIDNSLMGKGFEDEIFNLFKVACDCIQPFPNLRPTMFQVYKTMSSIWEGQRYNEYSQVISKQPEIGFATSNSKGEIIEL